MPKKTIDSVLINIKENNITWLICDILSDY